LNPFGIRVKLVEPGAIATDFVTRSLDVLKKDGLTAYDEAVAQFTKAWRGGDRKSSPAELVADVIYEAATDGTDKLRYIAGADAEQIIEARGKVTQEQYYALIRTRLGM